MMNYAQHKQADRTLRLDREAGLSASHRRESIRILSQAKKSSLELPSDELGYQCRLAKKRLHTDRLVNRLEDGSRRREDLHKSSQLALKSSKPSRIAEDTREPSVEEEED